MSVYFDKPRLKGINASTGQAALICKDRKTAAGEIHKTANWSPGGGVLDIFLGGEVWRGPSYPDPV